MLIAVPDQFAFRSPESTVLPLLVWATSLEHWAILQRREERERRAMADCILQAGEARDLKAEPVAG